MSEVQKLETAIETEAVKLETAVKTEASDIYAGTKKFESIVAADVKKAFITLTTDEKLTVTAIENSYLKLQIDIAQKVKEAEALQRQFDGVVASIATKYAIDPAKYAFDIAAKVFKAL